MSPLPRCTWRTHEQKAATNLPIAFIDLAAQRRRLGSRIDEAIQKVLASGQYILGPEVTELEKRLAEFSGAKHAITCANGIDAIQLVLMALGIGAGDAVFVPGFTFVATAEMVAMTGATPVFVDVGRESFNMDAASLKAAIAEAKKRGLKPKAVLVVDLYGQPADYAALKPSPTPTAWSSSPMRRRVSAGLLDGKRVGSIAKYTTTSFYPAKPLGCYGDGGAMFTDDDRVADLLLSLRYHGKGGHQYDNVRVGMNSRLDTMQAAILIPKLEIFADEIEARQRVADRYAAGLSDVGARAEDPPRAPRPRGRSTRSWSRTAISLSPLQGRGRADRDPLSYSAAQAVGLLDVPVGARRLAELRVAGEPAWSACRCIPISTRPHRTASLPCCARRLQPTVAKAARG